MTCPLTRAVGDAICVLRRESLLTQEQLARACNLYQQDVSLHESGKRAMTLRALADYAIALGTTPSEILRRAERLMEGQS